MKRLLSVIVLSIMASCTSGDKDDNHEPKSGKASFVVEYAGALKNIMHRNDLSAKIGLSQFSGRAHFYALGALKDLKGEILVIDGEPYITSEHGDSTVIDHSFDYSAALLVYTTVENWSSYAISDNIKTYSDLEAFIEKTAAANGINTEEPFPFMLEGVADNLHWHVVNWPEGDTEHTHEKHIQSGPNGTYNNLDVEILGFYSKHHHTIFTHHTTNMHLHFISQDKKYSGHLDGLDVGKNMKLLLPASK